MPGNDGLAITGVGILSAIGQGKAAFWRALVRGDHAFGYLARPGRVPELGSSPNLIGAEISEIHLPAEVPARLLRSASLSARAAIACVHEAWHEARLDDLDPRRIGLVVGGSNFQQRELVRTYEAYRTRPQYVRPSHALAFMDTDVCGICTELFPIQGFACSLGGASASGQVALIQAAQSLLAGQVDACVVVGALCDLSFMECAAFHALGAMGSERFRDEPDRASRPFDDQRDGFVFGENSAAVVIEHVHRSGRTAAPYAWLAGWGSSVDRNRGPEPSGQGEQLAMDAALRMAGSPAHSIDYVNPHGSGSVLGDRIELQAMTELGLTNTAINTTKSIVGHGLCAAGLVEVVATALQMREGVLHPCRNLEQPIAGDFDWVFESRACTVERALNVSIGFGGLNTAVCLKKELQS